jgi:hypothetical protein
VCTEVFVNVSLPKILRMFGKKAPSYDQWYERTKLAQNQSKWVTEKEVPARMLTNAENILAVEGNLIKVDLEVDKAAGTTTYFCNSSKYLVQDGKPAASKSRVKNFLSKQSSETASFKAVSEECLSLHKIIAYPCESVACKHVYICDCLNFKVR